MTTARTEPASQGPTAHMFDLFIVHAAADADFVRGYLLPALDLPPRRVLLIDELTPGAWIASEIDHGVSRSRFTVVVLSPAYLEDSWAVFGEQLASYLSMHGMHVIPLRLIDCQLPLRLEARVALDFTDRAPPFVLSQQVSHVLKPDEADRFRIVIKRDVRGQAVLAMIAKIIHGSENSEESSGELLCAFRDYREDGRWNADARRTCVQLAREIRARKGRMSKNLLELLEEMESGGR